MIGSAQKRKIKDFNTKNKKFKNLCALTFISSKLSYHLMQISIKVNRKITKPIYDETINLYKQQAVPLGLDKDNIPTKYIEDNHINEILNKMKVFIFKFLVIDFLFNEIRNKKTPITNYPRLTNISKDENFNFKYDFDLSIADPIELKEWKNFAFKAPKRKKYKDLDKQVENFIKKEGRAGKKQDINVIQQNDWIIFEAILLNTNTKKRLLKEHKTNFCMKINKQFAIHPFQKLFIDKKTGDTFITRNFPIEEQSLLDGSGNNYLFLIKIKSITKGSYFSTDIFKSTFKLKSKGDVHKKLIESFSFKDDISQRRSTVEESFHLLLSKHRFEVPTHIVIRRKEDILLSLKKQPDFQVYRNQKDFDRQITMLAEQQLKEEILMDQIRYAEGINIEEKDIQNYLHLLNNNRLREFIHFKPPHSQLEKTSSPINTSTLKQIVGKEKTLNHIIHVLTR